jgi:hypothetical protein
MVIMVNVMNALVEAGSNTSTVALQVLGGDEANPVSGCTTGHPLPRGCKYEDLALQVGGVSHLRL